MTLRERVARAIAEDDGARPDAWVLYLKHADAAIAIVLEEAAQMIEADAPGFVSHHSNPRDRLAAAIRAMKEVKP